MKPSSPALGPGLRLLPMASSHRGALSPGCQQCAEGRKMVLFVTGLCRFRCFYCPVSERRNQKDVTYANERLVLSDSDVLEEARAMGASGTGITGGDPLGCLERTVHYVELLKAHFGASHHIHLYTHEPNAVKVRRLADAGLDELRLHIPHYVWGALHSSGSAYRHVLEESGAWGIRRGVEVPVLPEKEMELRRLIRALARLGVDFVNLNELEFSETNDKNLRERGYRVDVRSGWGVRGSRALAERLVRERDWGIPVHYCSSRFKDGVQLRRRLLRRAELSAPPFAERTPDGTILLGIVDARGLSPGEQQGLRDRLIRELRLRSADFQWSEALQRLELSPSRLRRVAPRLGRPAFLVEEYPTADRLEVERTPLNRSAFPGRMGTGGW
jgi:pyruvate formate-lyase activating enzyme-like uncharacterized protein